MSTFRPVSSLLFTTAFLLAGHGLHMTFLPLRASELGLSQTLIGLSGSAYFAGFLTGALMIPPIIARVGHIRSFTALLAISCRASCSSVLSTKASSGSWSALCWAP